MTTRAFDTALFVPVPANVNDGVVVSALGPPFTTVFKPMTTGGGGGGDAIVGSTPPTGVAAGQLWFDNVGGQLYVFYDDGTSSQWVVAANSPAGTAPGAAVTSVAGRTGDVVLTHTDITDWGVTLAPYALTSGVPLAGSTTPAMDGAATAGVGTAFARTDHIHPTDTTRASAVGTVTNDNAAAGFVGEIISSTVGASAVTLTNNVVANLTSIALTAGDWDVSGEVWIAVGSGAATIIQGGISPTSAVIVGSSQLTSARNVVNVSITASTTNVLPLRACRVSLAAPATYYLVAGATFLSGVTTAGGNIIARRAR